jgi:hypothetical protein
MGRAKKLVRKVLPLPVILQMDITLFKYTPMVDCVLRKEENNK